MSFFMHHNGFDYAVYGLLLYFARTQRYVRTGLPADLHTVGAGS